MRPGSRPVTTPHVLYAQVVRTCLRFLSVAWFSVSGMTAAIADDPTDLPEPDPVTAGLVGVLAWIGELVGSGAAVGDGVRIDRIVVLERLKAALEALQAVEIVGFARSQVVEQQRLDVDPRRVGRGIADQVALACKVSPTEGSRRLHLARDLCLDLPSVLGLLTVGDIGGWTARLVVGELSHLDSATRRRVDPDLARAGLGEKSPKAAAAVARRLGYAADPEAAVERCRTARSDRRVTLRPAPDTMSILSGLLPVEQGVACLAALDREAARLAAAGDRRGRGQIMADTLVERVTGQTSATDVPVEVQIVMPLATLLDPQSPTPGEVGDQGPVPARIVHDILTDTRADGFWRRLFTKPVEPVAGRGGNVVVGIDRRRRFTGPRQGRDRCPGPALPRPVLHRTDPAPRPHRPLHRRRTHHTNERSRRLRTRQLRPGNARLDRDTARPRLPHHPHHHPHRPPLPQPTRRPTLNDGGTRFLDWHRVVPPSQPRQ